MLNYVDYKSQDDENRKKDYVSTTDCTISNVYVYIYNQSLGRPTGTKNRSM